MENARGDIKNQADFLRISKRVKNAVLHSVTYPNSDHRGNHLPAICKLG